MTTNARSVADAADCHNLLGGPIDHMPRLLDQSYALRYQVYCRERKFLPAENYPNRLELDEFDLHSIHVGVVDMHGVLAGTARVVRPSELGLPLFAIARCFRTKPSSTAGTAAVVEVGRLAVSRSYKRPGEDLDAAGMRRRGREDVLLTLLKALYQQTKRLGATHWLAATEASLPRLLAQHGFPCRAIGPEADYFGVVTPYALDLKEFDDVILSRRFPVLDQFLIGLEPEFSPGPIGPATSSSSPLPAGDRPTRPARPWGVPRMAVDDAGVRSRHRSPGAERVPPRGRQRAGLPDAARRARRPRPGRARSRVVLPARALCCPRATPSTVSRSIS